MFKGRVRRPASWRGGVIRLLYGFSKARQDRASDLYLAALEAADRLQAALPESRDVQTFREFLDAIAERRS